MTNRKKRLEKGIESIEEQITIHTEKKATATEEGKFELADYYGKEIEKFNREKQKKEEHLED